MLGAAAAPTRRPEMSLPVGPVPTGRDRISSLRLHRVLWQIRGGGHSGADARRGHAGVPRLGAYVREPRTCAQATPHRRVYVYEFCRVPNACGQPTTA